MAQLPLIIVNPASAGGATGEAWPGVASDVRRHFGAFEVAFTGGGGEAAEIAEREARAGRRLVVACGGDGTISEVANGILRSGAGAELGVLPSGTGGDFRRTLGVPSRAADAARALREGETRALDAGRVTYANARGEEESRFFVNVASFGMGGEVIRRVKSREGLGAGAARLLGGKLSFAAAALQSALTFEKPSVRVSLDGGAESRLTVANFCVANARYFGGGLMIAPMAEIDDGLLDFAVIGDFGKLELVKQVPGVYRGKHVDHPKFHHRRARSIRIETAEPARVQVDGELAGSAPVTFTVEPGALRLAG